MTASRRNHGAMRANLAICALGVGTDQIDDVVQAANYMDGFARQKPNITATARLATHSVASMTKILSIGPLSTGQ